MAVLLTHILRHLRHTKSDTCVATINRYLLIIRHVRYLLQTMESDQFKRHQSSPTSVGSAVYAKYGEASVAGFQAVPDLLLKHQAALGLSPTDLVVLLNILMHWWYPQQKPFPRSTIISTRMGVSSRTVQRSISHLEALGLLVRLKEGERTYLDPSPLVAKLTELAKSDTDYQIRRKNRDTDGAFG